MNTTPTIKLQAVTILNATIHLPTDEKPEIMLTTPLTNSEDDRFTIQIGLIEKQGTLGAITREGHVSVDCKKIGQTTPFEANTRLPKGLKFINCYSADGTLLEIKTTVSTKPIRLNR